MRIANLDGRLVLNYPDGATDVEKASDGRFAADPQAVFARWDEFATWAGTLRAPLAGPLDPGHLEAPAPRPSQVFAIGLNYADHAGESKMQLPPEPAVFTKFQTSRKSLERRGAAADGDRGLGSGTGRRHRPACRRR